MAATAQKIEAKNYDCCCSRRVSAHSGPATAREHHEHSAGQGNLLGDQQNDLKDADGVRDPVCGMLVDPHNTQHRYQFEGRTYYFCSEDCLSNFKAEPGKYLMKGPKGDGRLPEGAIYTCPMHPQIRQVGPGSCPICGMALEPVMATADAGPNAELVDMTRRFWIGTILSVPVMALEMGFHLIGLAHYMSQTTSNWLQMILATPVVVWSGGPFFVRGWNSLVSRNLNMFTLIAMGTGVACIYSIVATVAPQIFPEAFRIGGGAVAVYFEAAAVITVLVLLGQVLELRARENTSGAIRALLDLAPKTARRLLEGGARGRGSTRRSTCRRQAAGAAR